MRILRMILRTVKESIRNIFRQGWLSFSAILSIMVTLLLTSILLVVSVNVEHTTKIVAQGLQTVVYFEYTVTDEEAKKIEKEVAKWENVKSVVFTTEIEEFNKVFDSFDNQEQKDLLSDFAGDKNPMHKALTITMTNPEDAEDLEKKLLQKFDAQISDIEFDKTIAKTILPMFDTIRKASFALILAVAFVAIILISNTIRITIVARRTEIGIMRLVAASNWYIRTPFILEGIMLGLIGAAIATGLVTTAYWYYLPVITSKLLFVSVDALVPVQVILNELLLWTMSLGGAIGFLGSIFPVRKYLRK